MGKYGNSYKFYVKDAIFDVCVGKKNFGYSR